jgi:hypothetical protein
MKRSGVARNAIRTTHRSLTNSLRSSTLQKKDEESRREVVVKLKEARTKRGRINFARLKADEAAPDSKATRSSPSRPPGKGR